MRCDVSVHGTTLLLEYYPDNDIGWVDDKFRTGEPARIAHVFNFQAADRVAFTQASEWDPFLPSEGAYFSLGQADGDYFRIEGRKLGIPQDVYIATSCQITFKAFHAARHVSVFKQIAKLTKHEVYIGGSAPQALAEADFKKILKALPSETELRKYVTARIAGVLANAFEGTTDAVDAYNRYRNRAEGRRHADLAVSLAEYETDKYRLLLKRLEVMLANESQYSEHDWQLEVAEVILLAYPQYLKAFREAPILDRQADTTRRVDFILVDADGHIDLLEIKKPLGTAVVSTATYRDNHVPFQSLSGTVMQLEKYLFHLTRDAVTHERLLNAKYGQGLPPGVSIRITNPRCMILMGRRQGLTDAQKLDFEVVRRHYRNVLDVMTYDDMLERMTRVVHRFAGVGPVVERSQVDAV